MPIRDFFIGADTRMIRILATSVGGAGVAIPLFLPQSRLPKKSYLSIFMYGVVSRANTNGLRINDVFDPRPRGENYKMET